MTTYMWLVDLFSVGFPGEDEERGLEMFELVVSTADHLSTGQILTVMSIVLEGYGE